MIKVGQNPNLNIKDLKSDKNFSYSLVKSKVKEAYDLPTTIVMMDDLDET